MAFAEKMRGILTRGVAEAKDLGAKGVLKVEIMRLDSREDTLISRLGKEAYRALADGDQATVSRESPSIRGILREIEGLRAERHLKDKEYQSIGGKLESVSERNSK
jgi:hypothetical protein